MPVRAEVSPSIRQLHQELLDQAMWRRIELNPPFKVVPFVEGSYLTKLPGKENEWVMTQDGAPLPGDGTTYGIGNPLPMRAWHAPNAGERARRIMEKGRRPDKPLSPFKEATLKEAQESYFFFPQIYGRRGTKYGANTSTVACLSTGLPWDRQTSIEDSARQILRSIAGDENAPIIWFGPHKAITVVRGSQTPREMATRLVESPVSAYEAYMPHLANAVKEIRNRRRETILGPGGKADEFEADFHGMPRPLERAFKEDGAEGMEWKYKDLVGINPDGGPQTMRSLAENGYEEDFDMKNKIVSVEVNIDQSDNENIYVVEVNFDKSATCCGFSSNAQRNDLLGGSFDPSEIGKLPEYDYYILASNLIRLQEEEEMCDECEKKKKECKGHEKDAPFSSNRADA